MGRLTVAVIAMRLVRLSVNTLSIHMVKPALNGNGFTIIELIIVVVVISLSVLAAIPVYNNFTGEKKLEYEALKLSDALSLARSMTNAPKSCASGQEFQGYRLTFTSSNYTIYQCCGTSGQSPTCSNSVKTYKITSPNVQITDAANYVHFLPRAGGTYTGSEKNMTLKDITENKCIKIFIRDSGKVFLDTPYPYSC